ncbi:protein FAM32A [Atheta coriaria]|uniref:protein FAM32A n=1 Tax=Dalotia coriaria TaxID=877792 RepID=UPI0031F3B52D
MADDPYQHVAKGKLSLKGDSGIKKKKKKKDKEKKLEEAARMIVKDKEAPELKKTNAELAFKKMQEKNQIKRILDKANMTHKERVEKFNQHLDSLTEHFDIPKVSWTK